MIRASPKLRSASDHALSMDTGESSGGEGSAQLGESKGQEQLQEKDQNPEPAKDDQQSSDSGASSPAPSGEAETIKVPQMAESISEGTLKTWMKKVGDHVEADEEIASIETDKVTIYLSHLLALC